MDLNEAIYPLVMFCRCLGLAPFTTSAQSSAYIKSRPAFLYSLVSSAGMLAALYATVPAIFLDRPKMAAVMETTSTLQAVCGVLVFAYSHMVCFLNRGAMLTLLGLTSDAGNALGLTSRRYVTVRRAVVVQMAVLIILEVTSAGLLVAGWGTPLSFYKAITFSLICLAELSNGVAEIQFMDLVFMLNVLYTAFCARLEAIPTGHEGLDAPDKMELGASPVHSPELEDPQRTCQDPNYADVSELHCTLYDISRTVCSLFGFQNLLFIVNDFCALLYGLYFIIDFCLGISQPQDTGKLWLVYVVFEGMFRCFRLVVMVTACSLVTAKAEQIAYIVSKLQTSAREEKTRLQMHSFSSQLVHRRISFTACGFLPIDASLITAIVGGVTTYLVIIIQFQMMAPPPLTSSTPLPL